MNLNESFDDMDTPLTTNNGPQLWNEILEKFPGGLIAGGAVRDWWLNGEPKDIDVFVSDQNEYGPIDYGSSIDIFDDRLIDNGWTYEGDNGQRNWEYRGTRISMLLNYKYKGFDVQIVYVPCTPTEHLGTFDLSTSLCWWDGAGVNLTGPFLDSIQSGQVKILDDNDTEKSTIRAQRVIAKYPDIFKEVIPYSVAI